MLLTEGSLNPNTIRVMNNLQGEGKGDSVEELGEEGEERKRREAVLAEDVTHPPPLRPCRL